MWGVSADPLSARAWGPGSVFLLVCMDIKLLMAFDFLLSRGPVEMPKGLGCNDYLCTREALAMLRCVKYLHVDKHVGVRVG